ncbi:MAG: PEP-CTERM sorting domain-containing protein [Cyanobacteria bacterium SBLK]|nr:PEP-CTERM sorting domain-containing protein [Cyanobacteria bacterium SBLK]
MKGFWVGLVLAIAGSSSVFTAPASGFTFKSDITGADMVGMEIEVGFLDGSSELAIWQVTGADSGSAIGTDWNLSVNGDTLSAPWDLSYTGDGAIRSLYIDTSLGNAVFDWVFLPELTPETGSGNDFVSSSGTKPNVLSYNNFVGNFGDIFTLLKVYWYDGITKSETPFTFSIDTDGIERLDPDPEPVPEPTATLGILGALVLGTVSLRKKK